MKQGYKSSSDHDNRIHEAVQENGIQDIRLPQGNDRKQDFGAKIQASMLQTYSSTDSEAILDTGSAWPFSPIS